MANQKNACIEALQWYINNGVDEVLADEPVDRTKPIEIVKPQIIEEPKTQPANTSTPIFTSGSTETKDLAAKAKTLEELKEIIANYDGIGIKKTASNLVFADGNPKAKVMLVGEAPGADEDRQGTPFVGTSGQLLDKILACINLDRTAQEPEKSVYISNIINWRPPGNRTPTPMEIEQSLPFIEKHIDLIKPDFLILCGGVSAKTLLHNNDSISKLRGKIHDYSPQTIDGGKTIPAIATYHPAYLLSTPLQKRAVWQDMLMLQDHINKT